MVNLKNPSKKIQLAAIVGSLALVAGTQGMAKADSITWVFNSPTGVLGTSQSYSATSSPLPGVTVAITATGYSSNGGSTTDLYGRGGTTNESGLGINDGPPTHEIGYGQVIQLDLTNLLAVLPNGNNSANITISSVQGTSGDEFSIYQSTTSGSYTGSPVAAGDSTTLPGGGFATVTITGLTKTSPAYLDVTETGNSDGSSVLLDNLQVSTNAPFPEPAALSMMGVAGLGILLLPRKRIA